MSDPLPSDLEIAKGEKILELEAAYEDTVHTAFSSSATGTERWYPSDLEGQVNMLGAKVANTNMPYRCSLTKGGVMQFVEHTAQQLNQAFFDGVTVKLNAISNRATKILAVENATTVAQVNAITW